jgi:glycogen debranching enzyme
MFNGWGVRALSENERRYDPIGYHLGTVWRTITRPFPLGSGATDLLKKFVAFSPGSASPFSIPPATWEVFRTPKGKRSEILFEKLW